MAWDLQVTWGLQLASEVESFFWGLMLTPSG